MQWIRDLALWQKFSLIGALAAALSLPATVAVVLDHRQALLAAGAELDGVAPVGALLTALRLTQMHRGASTGWLGGNDGLRGKRESTAAELDQAMAALRQTTQHYPGGKVAAQGQTVQQQWLALRDAVANKSIDGPTGFARHTALVADELRLLAAVADRSGLLLDPEAATYNLIAAVVDTLPRMTEQLGQARATGTLHLTRKAITPAEKAHLQLGIEQIAQLAEASDRHLGNMAEADAGLASRLAGARSAASQSGSAAVLLVRQQLLDAATPDAAALAYFDTMTGHIDAQFKLVDTCFAAVSQHLQTRVDSGRQTLLLLLSSMALLGGLGVWLMVQIARSTGRSVRSAQAAADALARGDLGHEVQVDSQDEIGRMAQALGHAMHNLAGMVREIKSTGDSVGTASAQIAAANADLSARTEHTAANLQQVASSMVQLHAAVRHNAESAQQATQLAGRSSTVAAAGGGLVGQVVTTMQDISSSSGKISDIVGVIDSIAFQTNILALNAAVEAARAGEQGRGFAVVAGEVRSLAQRCTAAAREIKLLINSSTNTVSNGSLLVGQAQQTMTDVVAQARQVSGLIDAIGNATQQQTSGIGQVNQAVAQLDAATQQNAALVEESAAAADSLRLQAARLVEAVSQFKLEA